MYLYKQKRSNGDTYLSIKEKYYVAGKGCRERTIEPIGMLSDLKKQMDDPVAYYNQYAADLTEKANSERNQTITIDMEEQLEIGTNDTRFFAC